jgi:subtilisin family serine protease
VAYIEADGLLHTQDIRKRDDGDDDDDDESSPGAEVGILSQKNATWGLSRISHRQKGATDYVYDGSAGEGTCAYIIDTGIYTEHADFEGRATFVKNFDKVDGSDADMYGHGTHVAGTIGSKTYGRSPNHSLITLSSNCLQVLQRRQSSSP